MATQVKNPKLGRSPLTPREQLKQLLSQVARLESRIRKLKAGLYEAARRKRRADRIGKHPLSAKAVVPAFPSPDSEGNYPAGETLRVILARQIMRRRQAAGWTQAELARRAGVRQETVSRIETGKHASNVSTVDQLDRALQEASV